MTPKICILAAALTATACTASPDELTTSTSQALGRTCATLYKDAFLTGDSYAVITNSFGLWEVGNLTGLPINNNTSSIAVNPGCHITVYNDADQLGTQMSYDATTNTVPSNMNDEITSWACYCVPQCGANQHYCGPDQGCVLKTQFCE